MAAVTASVASGARTRDCFLAAADIQLLDAAADTLVGCLAVVYRAQRLGDGDGGVGDSGAACNNGCKPSQGGPATGLRNEAVPETGLRNETGPATGFRNEAVPRWGLRQG
eukprot:351087-Chlamydomonas_euryale.AAC.3